MPITVITKEEAGPDEPVIVCHPTMIPELMRSTNGTRIVLDTAYRTGAVDVKLGKELNPPPQFSEEFFHGITPYRIPFSQSFDGKLRWDFSQSHYDIPTGSIRDSILNQARGYVKGYNTALDRERAKQKGESSS